MSAITSEDRYVVFQLDEHFFALPAGRQVFSKEVFHRWQSHAYGRYLWGYGQDN